MLPVVVAEPQHTGTAFEPHCTSMRPSVLAPIALSLANLLPHAQLLTAAWPLGISTVLAVRDPWSNSGQSAAAARHRRAGRHLGSGHVGALLARGEQDERWC